MRSSKDRTIQKKRVNKVNKIARTERSRKQRIANKHKREEIHAIDPNMKVIIINQKTFDKHGTEIEVMDGKIKAITPVVEETEDTKYIEEQRRAQPYIDKEMGIFKQIPADFDSAVEEYKVVIEEPVVEKIKLKNKSALQRLTDRFKKG